MTEPLRAYKPPVDCMTCKNYRPRTKSIFASKEFDVLAKCAAVELDIICSSKAELPILEFCYIVNKDADCPLYEEKKPWWKFWG